MNDIADTVDWSKAEGIQVVDPAFLGEQQDPMDSFIIQWVVVHV